MIRRITISSRLILGFSLLVAILAISSINSIFQIESISRQANKVVDLRMPTAQASASVLNGVNHALAALRGWMLLGEHHFKKERQLAWDNEITPAILMLEQQAKHWSNAQNITRLAELKSLMVAFEQEQLVIENMAQSLQNIPSIEMLYQQAVPQASVMSTEITRMIDIELILAANKERKALLGMMADVRGTLGLSLANIRGYLLSGEEVYQQNFHQLWAKNKRRFNDLKNQKALLNPKQKQSFNKFAEARGLFAPLPEKMLSSRAKKDWNLSNHWLATKAAPLAFKIKTILQAMSDNQKSLLNADAQTLVSLSDNAKFMTWLGLFVGTCIAIVLSFLIIRSIIPPLISMSMGLILAEKTNDLTVQIENKGNDEISKMTLAVNDMLNTFKTSIGEVADASGQISVAAEETSVISSQMNKSIQQQAGETDLIATAITEMAATVKDVTQSTLTTSVESDKANEAVKDATEMMQQSLVTITHLSAVITGTSSTVSELEQSSIDISTILEVINEVADQTNLLALNAAIEAARVGEQGRGFAVVADEVRALAVRTQESTGEINTIINTLLRNSKNAVLSMQQSKQQVDQVVKQAQFSEQSLTNVSGVIANINDMSGHIAAASEQQEIVTEEINVSVVKINDQTQDNVSAIFEISKSGQELSKLSVNMQTLVSRFKIA